MDDATVRNPTNADWLSWVEPPICIRNSAVPSWDDIADVVVIGFGGAGACAALEAATNGASVLAIDRFDGGGATALSGGVYYGGGTRYQREAGFEDSPDEMYKYLRLETKDVVSEQTLRRFCDDNVRNMDWLISHGVKFASAYEERKTAYPRRDRFLYNCGNEQVAGYRESATPAPRGHRTYTSGSEYNTGSVLYRALRNAALAKGVRLLDHAPAIRLATNERGDVVGVEIRALGGRAKTLHQKLYKRVKPLNPWGRDADQKAMNAVLQLEIQRGERRLIRATRGVILCAGGFIYNHMMLSSYTPKYYYAVPQGTIGDDGSGIRLGESVGAATTKMDRVNISRILAPPEAYVKGVLVNGLGERFISEDAYCGNVGGEIIERQGGKAWLIIDKLLRNTALAASLPAKGNNEFLFYGLPTIVNYLFRSARASTLEALARKCGMNPYTLIKTVDRYNRSVKNGLDSDYGKSPKLLHPLTSGPFWALDLSLNNKLIVQLAFTLGGLTVDEGSGGVRRDNGDVIKGLYAAGRTASGLPSAGYVSGLSIADCVFSGRRAGQAATSRAGDDVVHAISAK